METKVYIGNISREMTEQDLRTMFTDAGKVGSVDIIMDHQTGKSKGFAFVMMGSQAEAEKAASLFNEKSISDHSLKVNIARPREERAGTGNQTNKL
jgi:RNA recognition motif-containing protein